MQAIQSVNDRTYRTIETKGHRRRLQIIINRLGNSDNRPSLFIKLLACREGTVSPDNHKSTDPKLIQGPFGPVDNFLRHLSHIIAFAQLGCEIPFVRRA